MDPYFDKQVQGGKAMNYESAMNRITLRGTITATRMNTRNKAIYTIATDGDYGNSEFPEVIHMVNSSEEVRRVGENITAICHARSGKTMLEDNTPVYFKQIIADSVYKSERILSSYFENLPEEGTAPKDINEFVFCGEIYRVTVNPGGRDIVLITLKIPEDDSYYHYVEVVGFKGQAEIMKQAEEGDFMAVAGAIRTIKKENKYAFDYVARDVYLQSVEE